MLNLILETFNMKQGAAIAIDSQSVIPVVNHGSNEDMLAEETTLTLYYQ